MEYCQSVGKRVKKDCFVRCVNEKINGENKTENGGSGDGYDGANPSWYSFPIAFPSACYQVVTNGKGNGYGAKDGNSCGACNWNTKQVQLYSNDGTKPVNYIAIGK